MLQQAACSLWLLPRHGHARHKHVPDVAHWGSRALAGCWLTLDLSNAAAVSNKQESTEAQQYHARRRGGAHEGVEGSRD